MLNQTPNQRILCSCGSHYITLKNILVKTDNILYVEFTVLSKLQSTGAILSKKIKDN